MENIHIKLEYNEALFAKKELLSSQINALETLKVFKNFKAERKRDLILRTRLKKSLLGLKTEIEQLEETLPKEEEEEKQLKLIKKLSKRKVKKTSKKQKAIPPGKKEYKEIESELQTIKEKLVALG